MPLYTHPSLGNFYHFPEMLFPIAYSWSVVSNCVFSMHAGFLHFPFPAILLLSVDFIGKTSLLVSVLLSTVADVVGMLLDVTHLHLHLTV